MLGANVSFTAGCSKPQCQQYSRAELVRVVEAADVVLICLGTGRWEREGTGWALPGAGECSGRGGVPMSPL